MSLRITCLMPVYNRYPHNARLVEEAVQSFLLQDYPNKELIICNDTPGQELFINWKNLTDDIRILNMNARFPNLSDKLIYMMDHARGDAFCRWDDDDISLPWRLSLSRERLGSGHEWRSENHFYDEQNVIKKITEHPGNTHVHSIFTRKCLEEIGGYPRLSGKHIGAEDQAFTQLLRYHRYPDRGELLKPEEVFYLYRWGVSPTHLSGLGENAWDIIGKLPITSGNFEVTPRWYTDHLSRVKHFLA